VRFRSRTCVRFRSRTCVRFISDLCDGTELPQSSPKRIRAISLPMSYSSLTQPEELLLAVAARIDTAIRYKEANPEEDYGHYLKNLSEELVSLIVQSFKQIFVLTFSRNLLIVFINSFLQPVVFDIVSIPLWPSLRTWDGLRGIANEGLTLVKSQ
jgi:hypothetical protein